jgi:hypothetical protein
MKYIIEDENNTHWLRRRLWWETMKLREVAHARARDKGNIANYEGGA